MPCPFTGRKIFFASPNFLSQPKNLTSSKTFVPAQISILLNANHLFVWHKSLWLAHNVNKFLVQHKKFGPAQNILGPVKGQGLRVLIGSSRFNNAMSWLLSYIYTLVKSSRIYTGQYTFPILLLNDDNMLGEHKLREKNIVYGRLF